ncbi:MAG: hypothetical protein PHS42_03650 [Sulfurimonas sp.]|nr:hypothetical protein [Sulfurimonas sp.]MDD3834547.1 hypothetical protein [Sulfurimonas sp.]
MNPKLEKFINKKQVGKSVFYKHREEILELKSRGFSAKVILEYLETVGIKAKKSNLNRWLKRQVQDKQIVQKPTVSNQTIQKPKELIKTKTQEEALDKLLKLSSKKISANDMINHGRAVVKPLE